MPKTWLAFIVVLVAALAGVTISSTASPAFDKDKDKDKDKAPFVALDANGNLAALISKHAAINHIPEDLIRRVIMRESGGNPGAINADNFGLMQIKLETARGLGYRGDASGLLDADTNMTYAVKYLAGAYRLAGGDIKRAIHYYAAGYYYAAKRQGLSVMEAANSVKRLDTDSTDDARSSGGPAANRTNEK